MPKTPARPRQPRLAEVVAGQIETLIVERGWPVGESLGSETELIERFNVSRAAFREAVRIVEHHNVARMRRGPGGGLIVEKPDETAIVTAVQLYLAYAGVEQEKLYEVRVSLELAATGALATTIDEGGVRLLREGLEAESQIAPSELVAGYTRPNIHLLIAQLTDNPAIALFVEVLWRVNDDLIAASPSRDFPMNPELAACEYHRAHEAIVEAIVAGDVALAQHRMRRHLDALRTFPGQRPDRPGQDPTPPSVSAHR